MKYSLNQLEHFYHVSAQASFAKAAKTLQISNAQISQSIAKLERALGTKLFHRTTRSVALTTAGERLYPYAESIINTKNQINQEVSTIHDIPAGPLTVTCPSAFAECYLAPFLADFMQQYPQITLDLKLSSKVLNLEKEKVDIAIRLTHEPPQDRIAKHLGYYQIGYFATAKYLGDISINNIHELGQHNCLASKTVLSANRWLFEVEGKQQDLLMQPILQADNIHLIKTALLNHLGIACLPYFMVKQELANKTVMPLLENCLLPPIPVYAIYASTRKTPSKIKVFLDYLSKLEIN